jgi:glycosyltransferase involved in cell wall biosynthesis
MHNKHRKPRVLMITTEFPPCIGSGLLRMLGFARGLDRLGWDVSVLTARHPGGDLARWIPPSVHVRRTSMLSIERLGIWGKRMLSGLRRTRRSTKAQRPPGPGTPPPTPASRSSATKHLISLDRFLFPTSGHAGWILPAILSGLTMSKRPDVLLSSFGPDAAHMAAMWINRMTSIPWVADFRDPYSDNPMMLKPCPTTFHRYLVTSFEHQFIRQAKHVITTTNALAGVLGRRYGKIPGKDVHVIRNAYDPDIFGPIRTRQDSGGPFTLAFIGSIYDVEPYEPFLRGVKQFIDSTSPKPDEFQLKFIGRIGNAIRTFVQQHNLEPYVEYSPLVPHDQAVEMMRSSSALLVIGERWYEKLSIPAKIYQYILANKPVFCVANNGSMRDLCQRHNLGPCVDLEDWQGVSDELAQLFALHQRGELSEHWVHHDSEEFSRFVAAKRLSKLLKTTLDE